MAKKKRDFWDDVDEEVEVSDKHQKEKSFLKSFSRKMQFS